MSGAADGGAPLPDGSGPFAALREQLLEAADAFAGGADGAAGRGDGGGSAVPGILAGLVDDVDRALSEELEIFPVCHHSPASALAMARRLREKQPRVVYLELCEDLRPVLDELRNCRLPVALQAFATGTEGFPAAWAPLNVVAPVTEASAEYQAIAYALTTPGVQLVPVDRSADHVFQWEPQEPGGEQEPEPHGPPGEGRQESPQEGTPQDGMHQEEGLLHGDAVGVGIGDLRPRFAELEEHLLRHGRVRHWSEWWDQYVEQPLTGADYATYRQVMVMIGSLFRRLRPERHARRAVDEDRERYMWTRIREHLAETGEDPAGCLYVCGAFHAASRVEQFGLASRAEPFVIGPRTGTRWKYGLIPSSHSAIEAQFGLAPGAVSIAAATWNKALSRERVAPFRLSGHESGGRQRKRGSGKGGGPSGGGAAGGAAAAPQPVTDRLSGFLARRPVPQDPDEAELVGWCVEIVRLARRNGYLASTADAIAVFETSVLLAGMRGRRRPTPYDFEDAAVTCIEKDSVPGRRDVRRLCGILLGGDRVGRVGYDALPPLARDVLDRLEPLGLSLGARTRQRALLDLEADPELRPCSDLLWMLRRLLGDVARPVMGVRRLGERSPQESWDLALGRNQRALVELGYEGVTIEQVLEQRLRREAWAPEATAATALGAVEEALLLMDSHRLADDLGTRAVELLSAERTVDGAPEVLRLMRRLLGHYRATQPEPPRWCEAFVTAGWSHYCTLLPTAFADEDSGARQVAAMLGFLFGMESFAVSLGCDRSQLEIALRQSRPGAPDKTALFWTAGEQLGRMTRAELRGRCEELLANPLVVPSFPRWMSGFVQALEPFPHLAPFVVELLSGAFARLPDAVLLPWLPRLVTALRSEAPGLMPRLVREAGRTYPASLPALDAWTPPWSPAVAGAHAAPGAEGTAGAAGTAEAASTGPAAGPVAALLAARPAACDAVAGLLGHHGEWRRAGSAAGRTAAESPAEAAAQELLARHAGSAAALAGLLAAARPGGAGAP